MKYFFLAGRLPPLTIGEVPDITWEEFLFYLDTNLSFRDKRRVAVIRRYYDLENIRRFWLGEPPDLRGNYAEQELEEALLTGEGFPHYVYDFLQTYPQKQDRLLNFPLLITAFFRDQLVHSTGFMRDYLKFERELRLVLMGFRAKRLGRDITSELQHEDPDDQIVAQLVAQRDAKQFEPPSGFEDLKVLFQEYQDDPLALYQAVANYRFNWIEERLGTDVFSINRILGYMIQLIMVLMWQELDKQKGTQIIDTLVKEAQ